MATFLKRNGRITATVRIKPHPSKSKTFDTMRDAKSWAKEIEVQLQNEKEGNYSHINFKDGLLEYRDNISAKKKGSRQEIARINYLIEHMSVNRSLDSVDEKFLVEWREHRLESVKPPTIRRELTILMAFFSWCIETKLWLTENPVKQLKLPAKGLHRERVISQDEIDNLVPFLTEKIKSVFLFALETGMRLSEITSLEWDRVFLDLKYIKLDKTKNGRPREVPLSAKAIAIIESCKKFDDKFVFKIDARSVSTDFCESRLKANLEGFTFHDTRHTAATRIAQKLQLLDLCKMFGWSDPKRAMVYYNPTSSEIAARL